MDQARAFRQAIQDEPDEDAPRLIYADWLEDHGESAQAEFIRAQVRLASLPENDGNRPALEDLADDLLAQHPLDWVPDAVREHTTRWEFRRGFVEAASLRAGVFIDNGDALFSSAPIRAIHLARVEPADLAVLAQSNHLERLEKLDLTCGPRSLTRLNDRAVRTLLESPHLTRLCDLRLADNDLEGPAIRNLVDSPLLQQLVHLDLARNYALGDRAVRMLAESSAESLETLDVRNTNLTHFGARALFQCRLPTLHTLNMDTARLLTEGNRDPIAELAGLLDAPLSRQLQALNFTLCRIENTGLEQLLLWMASGGLEELELDANLLGPPAGVMLAASPDVATLKKLGLARNNIRDEGAKALAGSPYLANVLELNLADNRIGGPGLQTLVHSTSLTGLRRLDLSGNFMGTTNATRLAEGPLIANLTGLGLSRSAIESEGVRALAESPVVSRLRTLDLSENTFDDDALQALASSPYLKRLQRLNLSCNDLTETAILDLADSHCFPRLTRLDLGEIELSQPAKEQLRERFGE
jgi:uncharacterized protein (TIGR02996 family)